MIFYQPWWNDFRLSYQAKLGHLGPHCNVHNQHIHCPLSEMCGLLLPYIVPSHEAWCAVCTHTRVLVFDIGLAQNPTRYLLPAPAARWSHVSSLDGITLFWRDEREIEWTIPIIGLSTYFSKFSDQPGKRGWISFLETRKEFCFFNFVKTTHFPFHILDTQQQDCN